MKHVAISEMLGWERFYRANFINTLSGFKSVSLIGTSNHAGNPNLAIFSNIVHIGADPALIGFVNRPREAAPHTLSNIEATGSYSINHVHAEILDAAHQTSAKYPVDESEFEAVGLTPEYREGVKAPFVKESKIQYAMELSEVIPIQTNGTYFVIGKLVSVFFDESILSVDGFLDISHAGSLTSLGLDAYYETTMVKRLKYAKYSSRL
jgi:flavin reductase (DIM6/NTAB) family NADH-FMN oxidoreductase RutF